MKLEYIFIDGYKNLNNLEIFFSKDQTINAFIGNNGSGKSNILEALTIIFSSIINSEVEVNFSFKLEYAIDESLVEINNIGGETSIKRDNEKVSKSKIRSVIPTAIFLYYAGETGRLKEMAQGKSDKIFDNLMKNEERAIKYLTYLSAEDFGSALLTHYIFQTDEYKRICSTLKLDDLCMPIELVFGRPYWGKARNASKIWNARGTVEMLLNKYTSLGRKREIDDDSFKVVFDEINILKDFSIGKMGLFKELKLLSQTDVLKNVEFNIMKNGEKFSYRDLSEGEKQIGQLMLVLDITSEYRSLFLLDEFDSYLHPNWQRTFTNLIGKLDIRGQVLFTTHSPLSLGKMNRKSIFLLKDGQVYKPSSSTWNRDISEIMGELMDVKLRPENIEELIRSFNRASIVDNDKEEALLYLDELKKELTDDDPFLITANMTIGRLERMKK